MRLNKTQTIVFLIILFCSGLVFILVLTSNYKNESNSSDITSETKASLPPIGENFEKIAKIELETEHVLDLGTIPNDRETSKKVKVYNKGNAPLYLRSIQTTCACTQGTIPPEYEVIPPNGEGYILVTVFPSRIAGFYSEKTLTIYSNDPYNSPYELKVIAKVEPEFVIDPEEINFGEIAKGNTGEVKITITQKNMQKKLEIYKIYEPGVPDNISNDIVYTIDEIKNAGENSLFEVTFILKPYASPGEFNRMFYLSTNIDRYPEVPLKIKGKVVAPYKLSITFPTPLTFNHLLKEFSKEVTIEPVINEEPVKIISYEVEPKDYFLVNHFEKETKVILNISCKEGTPEIYGVLSLKLSCGQQMFEDRVLLKNLKRSKF